MESLADLRDLVRPDDAMIALDMVQGYYHVLLHPSARTFCGFCWRGQYYVYSVLPFGLATAPRVFAKIMNVLARHWRSSGVRMLAYLDDWLFLVPPVEAPALVARLLADCRAVRIAINREKSSLSVVRVLEHLGFEADLRANVFRPTCTRWDRLMAEVECHVPTGHV